MFLALLLSCEREKWRGESGKEKERDREGGRGRERERERERERGIERNLSRDAVYSNIL